MRDKVSIGEAAAFALIAWVISPLVLLTKGLSGCWNINFERFAIVTLIFPIIALIIIGMGKESS